MSIKQQIDSWLKDKSATYSAGLALYNLVKISKKHDQFLSGEHNNDSMQFMLLKNNLIKASQKIAMNGEPPAKMQDTVTNQPVNPSIKKIEVKPLSISQQQTTPLPCVVPEPEVTEPSRSIEGRVVPLPRDSRRVVPTVEHSSNIRIADNPYIPVHLLDQEHRILYQEIKNQYPSAFKLHDNMKKEKSSEKRAAILSELIKLDNKIRANWNSIDDWAKANLQPEDLAALKPQETAQLETSIVAFKLQRIKSLNDMISRETRNLNAGKMKPKGRLKAKVRVDKWKVELDNLKSELNVQ